MATTTRFLPDTSCIVPILLATHPHHEVCAAELEARLGREEEMVVAAHTLMEAYSVLTGMPVPHRAAPEDVWRSLHEGFVTGAEVVHVETPRIPSLLAEAARLGIAGGSVFDFLIAATAVDASASVLLTMNTRHFARFPLPLEIVTPAQ